VKNIIILQTQKRKIEEMKAFQAYGFYSLAVFIFTQVFSLKILPTRSFKAQIIVVIYKGGIAAIYDSTKSAAGHLIKLRSS